jgi:glycosyltransferase involved in cell wall biosynthesis
MKRIVVNPSRRTQKAIGHVPEIAIVTPAYNSEETIAVTIESVLRNDYPYLDYLVVDGKSQDNTVAVAQRYLPHIRVLSEADKGQSDALNKGLRLTDAEIVGWLNADDILYPDALNIVADYFRRHPEVVAIYGDGDLIDEEGTVIGKSDVQPFDRWRLIHSRNYIEQQSCFFRRGAFDAAGGLDVRLKYVMDWDLWIKLSKFGEMIYVPRVLSARRMRQANKTQSGGMSRLFEMYRMLRRYGATWRSPVLQNYLYETIVVQSQWGTGLLNNLCRAASPWLASSFNGQFVYRMKVSCFGSYPNGDIPPISSFVIPPCPGSSELMLQLWPVPIEGVASYEIVLEMNRKTKTRLILQPGSDRPAEHRWTGCDSTKFNLIEGYCAHGVEKYLDVLGKSVKVAASLKYRWIERGQVI